MSQFVIMLGMILALCMNGSLLAAEADCRAPAPLQLRVRFADEPAREALLVATWPNGLQLLDPVTHRELWSVASSGYATQQLANLNVPLGSSLTAIHLDNDGVHDRIYAGDIAGRVWRFDLRAGASPSEWMRATLLADLGVVGGGRGFLAPPDVSRHSAADGQTWLTIAIGTANTGIPRADHRFYVLRDSLAGAGLPLTEADLEPLTPAQDLSSDYPHGYYLPLGRTQVVTHALTVDGHIYFTGVDDGRDLLAGCDNAMIRNEDVPISVHVLLTEQAATSDRDSDLADPHDLLRSLSGSMPANSAVEFAATPAADGLLHCEVDTTPVPGCFLDTRPRRTWWRREDAD